MDAGPSPRVLLAASQRLAVGVHDSGLGWVEIHARASAGQIVATLSTASAAAHDAISPQIPAMREYLAGQRVRVDTLAAQPFQGSSEGRQQQASGNTRQGNQTPAAAEKRPAQGLSFEEESLSWVDVRV